MSWILTTIIGVVMYALLYYIGSLFMRLVMVQVVEDSVARFEFASIFALSMGLFSIFLGNTLPDSTRLSTPLSTTSAVITGATLRTEGLRHGGVGPDQPHNARFTCLFSCLLVHLLSTPLVLLYLPLRQACARRRRRRQDQWRASGGGRRWPSRRVLCGFFFFFLTLAVVRYRGGVLARGYHALGYGGWAGAVALRGLRILLTTTPRAIAAGGGRAAFPLATLGVAVVGLMGGYAAFSTPYDLLLTHVYYADKGEQLLDARDALARRQRHTLGLCASKRRRLAQVEHAARQTELPPLGRSQGGGGADARRAPPTGFLGLFVWARERVDGGPTTASRTPHQPRIVEDSGDLRGVITGFHKHSLFLFLSAAAVDNILQATARSSLGSGRFWRLGSIALGLYATTKLIWTVINIACSTFAVQDPDTRAGGLLRWLCILPSLHHFYTRGGDREAFPTSGFNSRILELPALVVNLWMILSSVRGLLLIVFQLTMAFQTITADTTAVVFSGMMGVYFIGQFVLLQQSSARTALSAATDSGSSLAEGWNGLPFALAPVSIHFYQQLNDWCFVLGFTLTFFVRRYVLGDPATTTVSIAHG